MANKFTDALNTLNGLTTTEKLLMAAGLGVGVYFIYSHFSASTTRSRGLTDAERRAISEIESGGGGGSDTGGGKLGGAPLPKFMVRLGGPTYYDVIGPVIVRSGPGTGYALIGSFQNGAIATSSGRLTDVGGDTYAELTTPDQKIGWVNTKYISPHNANAAVTVSSVWDRMWS